VSHGTADLRGRLIGASFIFNDLITGSDPDLEKAVQASRVLLHAASL
jgi:hypothetical protein